MADITAAELRARFPEFTAGKHSDDYPDDAVLGLLIQTAYQMTSVSRDATLYCAAHLWAVREEETGGPDGGSGELTSEKTGPVMQMFMTQAGDNHEVFFTRTPYGRTMLLLERRSPKSVFSVNFA